MPLKDPEKRRIYNNKYRKDNPEKVKKWRKHWYNNNSCVYRSKMEKILGRELKDGEAIHHIDMDHTNNDPENLYVYKNHSRHSKGHWGLNKLVKGLLKNNIIKFNDGVYSLK